MACNGFEEKGEMYCSTSPMDVYCAHNDIPEVYMVKSLIEDIRNVRFHKIETGLQKIEARTHGVKAMARCPQPIPCSAFNNDGSLFAYAVSYDWSKGAENHNPSAAKHYIYIHLPQETDVKGKPRIATSGRK